MTRRARQRLRQQTPCSRSRAPLCRSAPARSGAPRGRRAGVTDVVQQFVAGLPADAAAAGAYLQREAGAASAVAGQAAAAARAGALGAAATSALAAGARHLFE